MKKKNRDGKKSKFSLVQRYKIKSNIIKKFQNFSIFMQNRKKKKKKDTLGETCKKC